MKKLMVCSTLSLMLCLPMPASAISMQSVKNKRYGLGTLAAVAGVVGVAGYVWGNRNKNTTPVQDVPTASNSNNSIIMCESTSDSKCKSSNGVVSVNKFISDAGFRNLVRQNIMFKNNVNYIVMEVSR